MSEVKNLEQAKSAFTTLCNALDGHKLRYQKDEEKLSIQCGIQGDDLPVEINMQLDADRMLVMALSHMPFKVKEEKRLEMAVAVSAINDMLVDGCFDYDVASGNMFFRMTNSIIDSVLGAEVFSYMFFCSCHVIDEYNDKFLMLSTGMISLEQFLEKTAR